LRVVRASQRYGATQALKDAHLTVMPGEVHALVGENGAGKSTLIRMLAGVESGGTLEATLDGRPLRLREPSDAQRAGLRFVHQELNIVPSLSVAETVNLGLAYPRTPLGTVNWRGLATQAEAALAQLGVDGLNPATPMHRLAAGDAMLVNLARALVARENQAPPGLLVLDEPTAALSDQEATRLFDVILRLKRRGTAVLYVSHRMNEIFDVCSRVTVLRNGETVGVFDTDGTHRATLVRAMTGREGGLASRSQHAHVDRNAARPVVLSMQGVTSRTLAGVDLDLKAGTVTVVTGLPGSGRRELLRVLAGDVPLQAGRVTLEGRELASKHKPHQGPHAAWQAGVAFVPDERLSEGLFPSGSVAANLLLPHLQRVTRAGLVARKLEHAHATTWASRVGVRGTGVKQPVRELSGGNQQKVVLARALAGTPRVLLLGEPTRGVDVGAKEEIYTLVRDAANAGAAVLVATTDLEEAFVLADRMLVMAHGRLVLSANAADVTREAVLTAAFSDRTPEGLAA
jgi:ABC-type sugar transport system ATPase subunit